MKNPRLSVVIVSYNTKKDLKDCLLQLKKEDFDIEVFVVDNASIDGTNEMIKKEFSDWSSLNYIQNKTNLGFTAACNQPLAECKGDYVLFLNSDTIFENNIWNKLVEYLDKNTEVGVLGPRLSYENGKLQLSCFPSSSFLNLINILMWHVLPYNIAENILTKFVGTSWSKNGIKTTGWVSGACLIIRRELILELNGFDENFFLSAQDSLDLCLRAKKLGYVVKYYPDIEVIHYCGRSTPKIISNEKKMNFLTYMHKGHLYFFKKYHGWFAMVALKIIFIMISLIKSIVSAILFIITKSDNLKNNAIVRIKFCFKLVTMNI